MLQVLFLDVSKVDWMLACCIRERAGIDAKCRRAWKMNRLGPQYCPTNRYPIRRSGAGSSVNINISHRAHPTVHGFGSVYARDDSFRAADDETAVAVPSLFAVL